MQQDQGAVRNAGLLTPAQLEELRRTQAAVRSHQNAKLVDDYATSIMSSMLVVNGAAIGAVLTAVGTEEVFTTKAGNLLSAVALLAFGAGVVSALIAVLRQRQNAAEWRNIWEFRVHGDLEWRSDHIDAHGKAAEWWLWAGVVAFLLGAVCVAAALYTREPVPTKTAYLSGMSFSVLLA